MPQVGRGSDSEARRVVALCACTALSGCVAAAIPLVAGGAMVQSEAVNGESASKPVAPAPPQVPSGQPGQMVRLTGLTALPAPTEADMAAAAQRRMAAHSFDAFYGYALAQAETDPGEAPVRSALLQDPASLEPVRQDCGTRPAAVVIDLDPAGALYDPQPDWQVNEALAEVTAVLRSRKVEIAWISGQSAGLETNIRGRLDAAGLDPYGKDTLLLVDDFLPSKQQLRVSLARTFCIVAIAGDEPADFDELYSYLKSDDAALGLNEMFGAGWFLAPLPIE